MNYTPVRLLFGFFTIALSAFGSLPVAQLPSVEPAVLSEVQIQKLVYLNGAKGHDGTFFANVSRALGLTSVQVRQIVVMSHSPDVRHAFQLTPRDGGYVFIYATPSDTRFYRTDERQQLIAAVSYKGTDQLTIIPALDARTELAVEIGFWSQISNKL